MRACSGFRFALLSAGLLLACAASAEKRSIRVDNSANWTTNSIGSGACTGTAAASTLINTLTYTFSGRANTGTENYGTNDYCEVALTGTLNRNDYFHDDETGLRELFGKGVGVTGIRYDFLDNSAIFSADGFQWAFYTFPSGVTLVTLYGLDGSINNIVPDATSYIKKGTTTVWSGSNGYNGEYFCFQSNNYVGSWDGVSGNNACLNALGVVFYAGFE